MKNKKTTETTPNFQECAHLEVDDFYSGSTTHLADILEKQAELQDKLQDKHGYPRFGEMNLAELVQFWYMNSHAFVDEIHEAFNALGGIKDGIGSAAWKSWKADHGKTKDMTIKDLSDSDMKELKMEVVDMLHFFMNYWLSIGGTPQELYNMYFAKNKENHDRQKRGY